MTLRIFFTTFLVVSVFGAETGGRLSDPAGAPVARAQVVLTARTGGQRYVAETDGSGAWRLTNVTPGEYLLDARSEGLQASRRIRVDGTAAGDLRMELAPLMASVVVTASGTPLAVNDTGKALDVVDATQMEARADYLIADALRFVPGVRVQQLGGPGSFTRVSIRGLRSFDTAVLVDGFRLRDAASTQADATAFLSDLLVVNTAQLDILRGCASPNHGSSAMAGVVNIQTDRGGGPFHGAVTLDGGGLGVMRGVAQAAGGAFRDRLHFSAGGAHLNVTRGIDGDDRVRNNTGQGSIEFRLRPTMNLRGRLFGADAYGQLNASPSTIAPLPAGLIPARAGVNFRPNLNDPDNSRNTNYLMSVVSFDHAVTPTLNYRVAYQSLVSRRSNPNGPGGIGFQPQFSEISRFNGQIGTLQARADWQLGRMHLVSGGWEFEREKFDNAGRNFAPPPVPNAQFSTTAIQRSNALFLQDQVRLFGERLLVSFSGRVQFFDLKVPLFSGGPGRYSGPSFAAPPRALTGDVSVAYFLRGQATKLRAHFGNSYRAPALFERFGTGFFGGDFTPFGDPRLAPERSVSFDAGIDQYLLNSRVRVSASYFYTRLQSVVGFDFTGIVNRLTDPFGRTSGYFNTNGGLARGAELGVQAALWRGLTLTASYTYTNADERRPIVVGTLRSIRVVPHLATVSATQRLAKRWDASFSMQAGSEYLTSIGGRGFLMPGIRKADVALGYTLPVSDRASIRFFTRVDNILDQTYYEDGFLTPGAWAVGGLKFSF